jgi:hypothetical protein
LCKRRPSRDLPVNCYNSNGGIVISGTKLLFSFEWARTVTCEGGI